MAIDHSEDDLISLLDELLILPNETEWVEFKQNNDNPEEIGEYLSALANSAALYGKVTAFMVWGIDADTHKIVGTTFDPGKAKVGNEELENWLLRLLDPKINFRFYPVDVDGRSVVLLEIGAAFKHPVRFKGTEYIRIGSYKKKLKEHSEKERELWRVFDRIPFEKEIAAENIPAEDVLRLLDYPAYFDLLKRPLPDGQSAILEALQADSMIVKGRGGKWNIANLGAILFAKRISDFPSLQPKAVRVIQYKGDGRVETIREKEGGAGYASEFEGLLGYVTSLLPSNEVIGKALRREVPMFPEPAIRELVANAIIHQDFHITGTAPMVEIFSNRMEITNPGLPLVKTDRFLDNPPRSRNEALASFMRRIGVCEQRGSGIDKVVLETEVYQLPAPLFETTQEHTRAVLFAHREFRNMDKTDRIRACYLHSCLRYVQRDYMTNSTLRARFGIDVKNSATASRLIKEALGAKAIVPYDAKASRKYMKYIPVWAK